ncbi:MrcB family domain-containing protein [Paenibacillus sp. Z6-24]
MRASREREVSMTRIKERFLDYFQKREARSEPVDAPPSRMAFRWADLPLNRVQYVIDTPIEALSSILDYPNSGYTIGFKPEIYDQLNPAVLDELYHFTLDELDAYYAPPQSDFSLREDLMNIIRNYQQAKAQSLSGHPLAEYVRRDIPEHLKSLPFIHNHFKVQGSVGRGNWATIPWIAVLYPQITDTIQRGVYVAYLFSADMKRIYLTLNQGLGEARSQLGRGEGLAYLQERTQEIRSRLPASRMKMSDDIELGDGRLGDDYQMSTIAYFHYEADHLPDNEQLITDLWDAMDSYMFYIESTAITPNTVWSSQIREESNADSYSPRIRDRDVRETLEHIQQYVFQRGFYFPESLTHNFYLSLKTRPFVILAGISGTGKTRLVRLFAEAVGATADNGQFRLIPVRPDWSDPADLIGYKDLSGVFKPGPLTMVIAEASRRENRKKPYFVCLDEMNLARVEHYFSDMMSLLETQHWMEDGTRQTGAQRESRLDTGHMSVSAGGQSRDSVRPRNGSSVQTAQGRYIVTDPLISEGALDNEEDQSRYGHLGIPENVYIVGTVNMDETTYPFSKRVLDRANTIEFNAIDLMQLPSLTGDSQQLVDVVPVEQSFLRSDYLQLIDALQDHQELIIRTTERLVAVNEILEDIHAHVGFRIRDAVCFYLVYNERFGLMTEEAAFDLQLLQKILPRIQGSQSGVRRALVNLLKLCLKGSVRIPSPLEDDDDFWSRWSRGGTPPEARYPESARKLVYMIRRLDEDGFTSYWVS